MRIFACLMLAILLSGPAQAQLGPPSAELSAGIAAYNRGDFPSAFSLLSAAAGRGEAEAMVNLGYMYARGHAVRPDPARAFRLYQRAAEAGDAEGMNALGYRYNHAQTPDFGRAIHWYCRAILLGNPRAMNNAALLFFDGQGVAQNRDEAIHLWRQAIGQGSVNAEINLGRTLAGDPGLPDHDRQLGWDYIVDAAYKGSPAAQDILRHQGNPGPFPPPSETEWNMRLEPRNQTPGDSSLCGQLIS
jgi:uncharacterized protein